MITPRWTSPTNRPGTTDSWTGDIVQDTRYVLGEGRTGNSLTACLLREVERLQTIEARARGIVGNEPRTYAAKTCGYILDGPDA